MIHFITASQDASVYSNFPSSNAGVDSILEIKYDGCPITEVESYIKFNIYNLPEYIQSESITIKVQNVVPTVIPINFTVYMHPVIADWNMGAGTLAKAATSSSGITWNTTPTYDTSVVVTQNFEYKSGDINVDITPLFQYWNENDNNGLVMKLTSSIDPSSPIGQLQFYSKETNTFRQPLIAIAWDDQVYNTGSLSTLPNSEIIIKSRELRPVYPVDSIVKIGVVARERYPLKTFSNPFAYRNINYLPQDSQYAVIDVITKLMIVDFSEYTKISCDGISTFFTMDTTNFPTERIFKLLFKVDRGGYKEIFEDDITFIVR